MTTGLYTAGKTLSEQIPDVLLAVEDAMPLVPEKHRQVLLDLLASPQYFTDAFEYGLQELIWASPALKAFDTQANMEHGVRHAIAGPLFFWSLSQNASSGIPLEKMKTYLSSWASHAGGECSTSVESASFVASISMALMETRLAMSTAKKTKLRAVLLNSFERLMGYQILAHKPALLTHNLLLNIGLLAQSCDTEIWNFKPINTVWAENIKKTFHGLDVPRKVALLTAVLDSPLGHAYKMRACQQAPTEVWLDQTLIKKIQALLPYPEVARLPLLQWPSEKVVFRKDNPTVQQQLVAAYCPQSYPLLELILSSDDWKSQDAICKHAKAFSSKSLVFELPTDMDFAL